MERKTCKLNDLKLDDKTGAFSALFSRFGDVDKQGDLTMPGAFGDQRVIVSAYGHTSWDGVLPVGKGRIFENAEGGIFEGEFNLATIAGRETYETVKFTGDLQEWSYSLPKVESEMRTIDGQTVRVLKKITVNEISPVLQGAGNQTHLISIKASEIKPYPSEHSCRLHDPGDYEKFARKNCEIKHEGKCIDVVYGIKAGKSEIQAYRYPKDVWDAKDARAHCESHDGSFEAAEKDGNYTKSHGPLAEHLKALAEDSRDALTRLQEVAKKREAESRHPSQATLSEAAILKAIFEDLVRGFDQILCGHSEIMKEFVRFNTIIAQRRYADAIRKTD